MSSSSTNPRAYPNSLLARLDAVERTLARMTAVQPGKLRVLTATGSQQGFSWADGTSLTASATIPVPQFATLVSLIAVGTMVATANAAAGIAISTRIFHTVPALGFTQGNGPNVVVASNQQQSRSRSAIIAAASCAGLSSLTVTANAQANNTGTNVDNFVGVDVMAIFQY